MKITVYSLKICCWLAALLCSNSFAIPFNIVPKAGTSLPTVVMVGQEVSALYTVSNNSSRNLINNYVKYLPPGVVQVTQNSGISDLCGNIFNLNAKGMAGDSCTLQLNVTTNVNPNDPNPNNHLFVCLPGGVSCAGTYYPLNVRAITPNGQLSSSGILNGNQAIVATSQDQGQNWQFQTLTYPDNINSSNLNGSSCASQQCVLAGYYANNAFTLPGIATGLGVNSNSWNQQILPALSVGANGEAYGVNCYNDVCIAVGQYFSDSIYSYIASSQDQGTSWTQQILPAIDPTNFPYSTLAGVNCAGNNCVAVGYASSDSQQYSSIAYSTDSGNNWQSQVLPLVDGTITNQLNGVACLGLSCIAVGDYLTQTTYYSNPGLAITNNGGETWSNTVISSLPDAYVEGAWQGVSCTTEYCIAVGYYSNSSYYGNLGIAKTTDFGKTWTQQALPIASTPTGLTHGILYGVQCNGNTCNAVGRYSDGSSNPYPVFVRSTDSGQTWTQQVYAEQSGSYMTGIG